MPHHETDGFRALPPDLRLFRRVFRLMPRGHRLVRALWRPRLRRLGPVRYRTNYGFDILLAPFDYIGWAIIMHGSFEPGVTSLLFEQLGAGDCFVDIGADCGWFTLCAAARLHRLGGCVQAYEPQARLCRLIRETAQLNELRNITVRQAAVSDCAGRGVLISTSPDRPEFVRVRPAGGSSDGIPIVALDDEFPDSVPNLLKIDAEGHELRILRGMPRLLASSTLRCLFIEVHPPLLRDFGESPLDLLDLLAGYGFSVALIPIRRKGVRSADLAALGCQIPEGTCFNILATRPGVSSR